MGFLGRRRKEKETVRRCASCSWQTPSRTGVLFQGRTSEANVSYGSLRRARKRLLIPSSTAFTACPFGSSSVEVTLTLNIFPEALSVPRLPTVVARTSPSPCMPSPYLQFSVWRLTVCWYVEDQRKLSNFAWAQGGRQVELPDQQFCSGIVSASIPKGERDLRD